MEYREEDYLQLSGIQHFAFCRRQWALIHIENQWAENLRTTEGAILHQRAHDVTLREARGDVVSVRGVSIHSAALGVSGQCDVVEYRRGGRGVPIRGLDGTWVPYPVEYKRGEPKITDADRLQLCGQALCLEEMLCCDVPQGALYYGETRRREKVDFTPDLRQAVRDSLAEMHRLYDRGHTPRVKPSKACNACSLKQLCLPKLLRNRSVSAYLSSAVREASTPASADATEGTADVSKGTVNAAKGTSDTPDTQERTPDTVKETADTVERTADVSKGTPEAGEGTP